MLEKDKLFFFKKGLKPRDTVELQRARVEKLDIAIIQAEELVNYQLELRREMKPATNVLEGMGNKFNRLNNGKGRGDRPSTLRNDV